MAIRVIKVKRRLSASPPPDLLLLSPPEGGDPKRSRTDLATDDRPVALFKRLTEDELESLRPGSCPEALVQPGLASALGALSGTRPPCVCLPC